MLAIYRPYRHPVFRTPLLDGFWKADLFSDLWSGGRDLPIQEPKVAVKENKKNYLIEAQFPGFDKDNIHAELEDGVLTLHAKQRDEQWDQDEAKGWRSITTHTGTYQRSFVVPEDVQVDKIRATMKKGVLRLTLPRNPDKESRPKQIEIR